MKKFLMMLMLAVMLRVSWTNRFGSGQGIVVQAVTMGNTMMLVLRTGPGKLQTINLSDVTESEFVEIGGAS